MFELRCTVRDCPGLLQQHDDGLKCAAGHHFDRSRQGYWNLLQPHDKKSLTPGDSDAAVLARHQWLARGHVSGMVETIRPWTMSNLTKLETNQSPRTLDLGCGEGTFGLALFPNEAGSFCGIDLSKRAIKLAARSWPSATWVLANADRILPAADESVHRVVSLFGRRPVSEIRRVLGLNGICIVAVPGEDDLIELREKVQRIGTCRSRWETVVEEFAKDGLECIVKKNWKEQVDLEPEAIMDALAMTYRAARHSEQSQAIAIKTSMKVTLAADLMLFRRN